MSKNQKQYITTREAAELLGVAVSTVQLWTNNGSLRAWTTEGGHRRIIRSSVEEMCQQRDLSHDEGNHQQFSVVVVEDNVQQRRMYEKQFRAWGANTEVFTAKDGYEGLVKIGQTLPQMIITDLKMPNMDGFEMIKALKKMPELENATIIAISGLTDDEIAEKGGLPEGVELLIKPIPFERLEVIIREMSTDKVA